MGVSTHSGPLFEAPIISIIVYWGLFWGPLCMGLSYHFPKLLTCASEQPSQPCPLRCYGLQKSMYLRLGVYRSAFFQNQSAFGESLWQRPDIGDKDLIVKKRSATGRKNLTSSDFSREDRPGAPSIHLCMTMYIHTYVYTYIYVHKCVYIYVYIYIYICMYLHACIYIYMSVCLPIRLSFKFSFYICIYVYMYICIYIYIRIHA